MVLKNMGLGGLFSQKSGHPLADMRGLRKMLGEVPKDNAFNALDTLSGWLVSLPFKDLGEEWCFEVLKEIEAAAQSHLGRLSREYLFGQRLSRAEEKRLWQINEGFWHKLADAYDACLRLWFAEGRPPEALRGRLPELSVRLIGAYAAALKWEMFQNGCGSGELWRRMGNGLLAALRERCAGEAVSLPGMARTLSPLEAYDQVMVFHTASLDALRPAEIELAERLLQHFLPRFGCTAKALHDSTYWVDLKLSQPPQRLAKMPEKAVATQRFFKPDATHEVMMTVLARLESGESLPESAALGHDYSPAVLTGVMRHLVTYLSPNPPLRLHPRHRVRHLMRVCSGYSAAMAVVQGLPGSPAGESWTVDNVSLGGFGALQKAMPGDAVKVGSLLAMQPEGGENWLLGLARRVRRENDEETRVGIEVLSRHPQVLQLRPQAATVLTSPIPTLLLDAFEPGQVRLLVASGSLPSGLPLSASAGGQTLLLTALTASDTYSDFQLVQASLQA